MLSTELRVAENPLAGTLGIYHTETCGFCLCASPQSTCRHPKGSFPGEWLPICDVMPVCAPKYGQKILKVRTSRLGKEQQSYIQKKNLGLSLY